MVRAQYSIECPDGTQPTPLDGCEGTLTRVLRNAPEGSCNTDFTIWVANAGAASEVGNAILSGDFRAKTLTVETSIVLPPNAIGTDDIADRTITRDDIADDTLTSSQIGSDAIGTSELANNAVTTAKIANDAVTSDKIANDAVTSDKLAHSISIVNDLNVGDYIRATDIVSVNLASDILIATETFVVSGDYARIDPKLIAESDAEIKGYLRLTQPKVVLLGTTLSHVLGISFKMPIGPFPVSIHADGVIYSTTYVAASDERIKENIQPLADFEALHIIRKLDAKSYEYKDKYDRGWNRTLGFIAQDVQKHIPEAVKVISKEIPSIYDGVEVRFFKQGDKYEMKLLNRVLEPGKYAFYVSDTDDKNMATVKSVDMTTEDGITFISNDKHDEVLLRGPYVDDFLTIDKNKIFAVAYAALQQVDKNQQALTEKVATLEETVLQLSERLAALEK